MKKLEGELKECRSEMMKEKNNLLMKVAQLETEKNEVEMREQLIKENMSDMKFQKEKMEKDFKNEMTLERNEF